jgi:hypothetical protein
MAIINFNSISGVSTISVASSITVGNNVSIGTDRVTATTFSGNLNSTSGSTTVAQLNVGTGGTVITTTAGGLVGIGTTIPKTKLHIQDGFVKIEKNANEENTLFLRNANTSGSNAYSVIRFSESNDFTSPSTPPGAGNAYIHYFNSGYATNGYWDANSLASGTTNGNINFSVGGNNQFKVWTNGSQRFAILGNGNTGIGTTNPNQKLVVNGKISNDSGLLVQPVIVQSTMIDADANGRFVFDLPSDYTFYKITGRFRFEGANTYRVWGDMVWDDAHTGSMEGFTNMWQNGPVATLQDTISGRYFEVADPVDASSFPVDFTVYVPTKSFNEGTRMGCWGEMRYTHSGVGNALSIFSYGDISASGTDRMTQFAWDIDAVSGSLVNGKCIYIIEAYPFTL